MFNKKLLLLLLLLTYSCRAKKKKEQYPHPELILTKEKKAKSKKKRNKILSAIDKAFMYIVSLVVATSPSLNKEKDKWDLENPATIDFSHRPVNRNILEEDSTSDTPFPPEGNQHPNTTIKPPNTEIKDEKTTQKQKSTSGTIEEKKPIKEKKSMEETIETKKNIQKEESISSEVEDANCKNQLKKISIKDVKPTYKILRCLKDNRAHEEKITHIAASKDGRFLISTTLYAPPKIWDTTTKRLVRIYYEIKNSEKKEEFVKKRKKSFYAALFFTPTWITSSAPIKWYFILGGDSKKVNVFSLEEKVLPDISDEKKILISKIEELHICNSIHSLAITPDQTTLVVGTDGGISRIYQMKYNQERKRVDFINKDNIKTGINQTNHLAFSHDGHLLSSAGIQESYQIWTWKEEENTYKKLFANGNGTILGLSFSQDEYILATSDSKGHLFLHNFNNIDLANSDQCNREFTHINKLYTSLLFISPQLLALGFSDGSIEIWHVSINQSQKIIVKGRVVICKAHKHAEIIAFSFYNHTLVAGSSDGIIRLWRWKNIDTLESILANYCGDIQFQNVA